MRFTLNGSDVDYDGHPLARLLDVVRERFGLTGTKEGCGEGECGACTVLVDGLPVNACLVPVGQVEGARVTTIEGLVDRDDLKRAFVTEGGAQCGICTPGMIVSASVAPADADREKLAEALAGNLCRCTGYEGVYRACRAAGHRNAGPQGLGG